MSVQEEPRRGFSALTWALIAAAILLFVAANVHLLYVAMRSQTECVPHLKDKSGTGGTFRAAKSGC